MSMRLRRVTEQRCRCSWSCGSAEHEYEYEREYLSGGSESRGGPVEARDDSGGRTRGLSGGVTGAMTLRGGGAGGAGARGRAAARAARAALSAQRLHNTRR